ncbi:AraC-like ligand-binding domain-containing protein [Leucobacter celer]|uniref:AraC-like ligand-binding domain-containing protein n=1 Tax=Leucobacter celer TaxID=668625 RepID=UPI0006A784CB|nr:helix-turn-helix domain-containing protein [Leucobacter celer]
MDNDVASSASVRTVESREIGEYADLVSERFAPLQMETDRRGDFRGRLRGRRLGEIEVFDVRATQHRVDRGARIASSTPQQKYMLHLQLCGTGVMEQEGREAVLHPGDLGFYDSDKPYFLSLDDRFRNAILVFPQRLLALPPMVTAQLTATKVAGAAGVAGMVASMLNGLAMNMESLPRHSSARLAHGIVDLLTTAMQNELGATPEEAPRSSGAPMREILAYIEDHLSDPDLGPDHVAAANFISVRTLHAYFRKADTSVAAWIRSRRLELCRQDLSDPMLDRLPVSTVMTRRGFVSIAHFSRLFKSAYGQPPTEFRRRMLDAAGDASSIQRGI